MHLAKHLEALQHATAYRRLIKVLMNGGIGSMGFGALMVWQGIAGMSEACVGIAFLLIGAMAIAEGIWVIASPSPGGLLAEAGIFLLLVLINGLAFLGSLMDDSEGPAYGLAALSVLQLALAISFAVRYRKFAHLPAERPPPSLLKWVDSVAETVLRANFPDGGHIFTFRAQARAWKAVLLADAAVVVDSRQPRLLARRRQPDVHFVAKTEMTFRRTGKELTTDRLKGRLNAGALKLPISVSPESLKRLEAWQASDTVAQETVESLPALPLDDLEERYASGGAPESEASAPMDRAGEMLADLERRAAAGPSGRAGAPKWCGYATASLVLSLLFCLGPLTALPAVVFGHIGLSRIKRSGGVQKGRGMAIAGLILGYVVLAFSAVIASALPSLIEGVRQGLEKSSRSMCATSLKSIGTACRAYAAEHQGRFPDRLSDLYPDYIDNLGVLTCHAQWDYISSPAAIDKETSYILTPSLSQAHPPKTVLVTEPEANHRGKGRHVLYVTGEVEWRESLKPPPGPSKE